MSEDKLTNFLKKAGFMGGGKHFPEPVKFSVNKSDEQKNISKKSSLKCSHKKGKSSMNEQIKKDIAAAAKRAKPRAVNAKQNPAKSTKPKGKKPFLKKSNNGNFKGKSKKQNPAKKTTKGLNPIINKDDIRVVPLGGMEQVGGNMMFIEWGNDIIIIDVGLNFPSAEHHGIDVIIPNIEYLVKNKHKIRGIFFTHGHLDHIGAAKYTIKELGYPQMYATKLTKELIIAGAEDKELLKNYKLREIDRNSRIKAGKFDVEFFHINHSIPDGVGVCVNTPHGAIVHTGDFKIDMNPHDEEPADLERIKNIGKKGVVLAMVDSTGAITPGHTKSESVIEAELVKIIESTKGRMLLTTFASNVGRVARVIEAAERCGRTVYLSGRSMERNIAIAKKLGYLKCKDSTLKLLSRTKNVNKMDPNKTLLLSTGSQGEQFAALTRMASGMHREIKLTKNDTIIFSTSPIPGNELAIVSVLNNLAEIGVKVIDNKKLDTHVSGHGHQEELIEMTQMLRPRNIAPIHGEVYMRHMHRDIMVEATKIPRKNAFIMKNGKGVIVNKNGVRLMKEEESVLANNVFIELGEKIGEHIMSDRELLSSSGIIIVSINAYKGKIKSIKVNSRGFRYMGLKNEIFDRLESELKKIYERHASPDKKAVNLETMLKQAAEKMIWQKFKKDTMVEVTIV